jgi:hypothetical protein
LYISPEEWNEARNEQQEKKQKTQTQGDFTRHFRMIHGISNISELNIKIPRIKQKLIHMVSIPM